MQQFLCYWNIQVISWLLEMSLIIWKVELKLDCANHCVLTPAGADNNDVKSNNVIFTIKDKKLYVPVVALSARDSQKLTKRLSKGFERSV